MNTPIQGTAADIIKIAMVHVSNMLEKSFPTATMVLQVHDELIIECSEKDGKKMLKMLEKAMADVMKLSVPLLAEAKMGGSWYEAK